MAEKNYNLGIKKALYDEVKSESLVRGTSVLEVFKLVIQVGLHILYIKKNPKVSIIAREGEKETEIFEFLPKF